MYKPYETSFRNQSMTIREKLYNISFSYVMFIVILAAIGIVMLYSAANGNWSPWAINRFGMGFAVMIVLALTDIKLLLRYAYVFYFITLILLVVVEVAGHTGMGATRWINLGFIKLQPSEFMKIAMVLVLARYFHTSSLQSIESVRGIIPPLLMAIFPAFLIVLQPDAYFYDGGNVFCRRRADLEICRRFYRRTDNHSFCMAFPARLSAEPCVDLSESRT